ncbi:SOS-induced cell division inhibitor SulA [Pseudomonas eucalypticola]|uniref:CDP-glycerol--UDP-pyrophosphoryl-N-acetylglucosaminyl-N-acetylmannosamine glycerophosphotransferase n=1 Tax=Pseudomonas eucalypticola TaxID=2599595 RepID=A0A7D5H558_9PSED|nr:SOS-induced cell division inhibitor SulA [Pseudomonas eucalypticola]QKZ04103.1 CDP-glycerol--UDP-pyrophosphoryl-N-acetylglucosaminyl-N-acetylmannosamine glycerophosphotransferase [Pseudomonas eucalypticola]
MQFPHPMQPAQLSLFEAFMAQPVAPLFTHASEVPWTAPQPEAFSEVSLRGAAGNCLNLLAPMLRELSEDLDARWLTLVAPPASLTQAWLRDAGLNRERILILQTGGNQTALQLAGEALRLGRSHTVVSWLNPLPVGARQQLIAAARIGDAQSLNIRMA